MHPSDEGIASQTILTEPTLTMLFTSLTVTPSFCGCRANPAQSQTPPTRHQNYRCLIPLQQEVYFNTCSFTKSTRCARSPQKLWRASAETFHASRGRAPIARCLLVGKPRSPQSFELLRWWRLSFAAASILPILPVLPSGALAGVSDVATTSRSIVFVPAGVTGVFCLVAETDVSA